MKLLVIHPGVNWAVSDVYDGLTYGLEVAGQQIITYRLDSRLMIARNVLLGAWRDARKRNPNVARPTYADVAYMASTQVIERALRLQPDWVIIVSGLFFHPDAAILLRRAGVKVAVLLTESPYDDEPQRQLAGAANVVFTNERSSVPFLSLVNTQTHYLAHAYHPERHSIHLPPVPDDVPAHDVLMVGTGWYERKQLLRQIHWNGTDLALYGSWSHMGKLKPFVKGGVVKNTDAVQLYRKAKVGLNWHRQNVGAQVDRPTLPVQGACSLNPRAYELAACGCFFLSDPHRSELVEVFGDTVPTFSDAASLEAQLARWLPDDAGRARQAEAIRERVRPHSWCERADEMLRKLQ